MVTPRIMWFGMSVWCVTLALHLSIVILWEDLSIYEVKIKVHEIVLMSDDLFIT